MFRMVGHWGNRMLMDSAMDSTRCGQQYRVFFVIVQETMVLLHGFQKKTQKTPAAEIRLARRRQKEVTSS